LKQYKIIGLHEIVWEEAVIYNKFLPQTNATVGSTTAWEEAILYKSLPLDGGG